MYAKCVKKSCVYLFIIYYYYYYYYCSSTLLPSVKAYKTWVGRIFLQYGRKPQKLLMLFEGTKPCRSFGTRTDKLLVGWIFPHNYYYYYYYLFYYRFDNLRSSFWLEDAWKKEMVCWQKKMKKKDLLTWPITDRGCDSWILNPLINQLHGDGFIFSDINNFLYIYILK